MAPDPKGQRIERVPPPIPRKQGDPASENVNFDQWMIRGTFILQPKLTRRVHTFQREAVSLSLAALSNMGVGQETRWYPGAGWNDQSHESLGPSFGVNLAV